MKRILTSLTSLATVLLASSAAFAQDVGEGIAQGGDRGFIALAVAFGIGVAALGGAFGQSRAAAAALEGISRNPNASDKVFVPMILGLAFIESLVLFTWVLMLLLMGNM